ncbi:FtsW/RodA/SpoVE family cell cycle protein, partial [Trichocoleus sp. ST-U1]
MLPIRQVAVNLRQLIPVFNSSAQDWAIDARLLRWLTFLWLFIGLVVLFSASYPSADAEFGDGMYYFKRQIISVILGLVAFNLVVNFPLRSVLEIADWFVILLLGVIFITLIPGVGTTTNGATRWIALGPFPLQPSELIKPFLVLQGARIFG